jgi:hypothetical protein
MQEKKDAGRCPHHGSPWGGGRSYACGCAIDKWTLAKLKERAEPATPRLHPGYTVEGEDDGYHD